MQVAEITRKLHTGGPAMEFISQAPTEDALGQICHVMRLCCKDKVDRANMHQI